MASQDWFEKDFYAILGVPKDADAAAIKKAYRKLARKHHPDAERRGRRRRAAVQGDRRGLRGALRPRAAPAVRRRSARWRTAAPASPPAARGGGGGRLRGPLRRPVRRRRRRRPAATSAVHHRRRRPASPTSRTCSAACSAAAAPVPRRRRRSAASAHRAARAAAPTSRPAPRCSFREAVEGATVTLRAPDGSHGHHRAIPAGRQGRPEDPAARQGRARATTGAPAGDLLLTVHGRAAPGLRPRRRQPHRRPAGHLRRGGARRARSRCRRSTAARSRCGSPPGTPSGRVLRVKGRGVKPARPAPATCWSRCRSSCRSGSPTTRAQAVEALRAEDGRGQDPRADLFEPGPARR